MKAALAILAILALAGAAWYYQQQTRTLAETVAQQQTELSAKTREIDKLEKALAKAQPKAPPAPGQPAPSTAGTSRPAPSPATGQPPAPETPTAPAKLSYDERLALMEQVRQKYAAIDAQHAARQQEINAARERANAYLEQVESTAPQFREHGPGKSGIRTSEADRQKELTVYNERLAGAMAGVQKVQDEQNKLNSAKEQTEMSFNNEITEIKNR